MRLRLNDPLGSGDLVVLGDVVTQVVVACFVARGGGVSNTRHLAQRTRVLVAKVVVAGVLVTQVARACDARECVSYLRVSTYQRTSVAAALVVDTSVAAAVVARAYKQG